MSLRVTHFMRDPRPSAFSIERLYEDVRGALPPDCHASEWVCRYPAKGLRARVRDALGARRAQGDVNHVTGDTHYLTYFLDSRRTVLTVHDLVSLERSKGLKKLALWFFWFWLPVARSRVVITVSEATRERLLEAVSCRPEKVVVIHNPVSDEFRLVEKEFNTAYPRILQVGTKSNKNLLRVAEALAGMRCKVVIVGDLNPQQEGALLSYGVDYESHVGLSRQALLEQYIQCDMLMFVSTYEGFGLPIIEANAVGRPVVASDLSPMKEVAGGAACLVDPYDIAAIRCGVARIIAEPAYRAHLVSAGRRNVERFRLTKVSERYAQLYRGVAGEERKRQAH